jgi:hypothetical protein
VVYNGVRIAKRGQPNSPQAGTWVSLEPGFRVFDKGYPLELVIERDGKIIKTVWLTDLGPQERNKVLAVILPTAIIVALLWIYLVALHP